MNLSNHELLERIIPDELNTDDLFDKNTLLLHQERYSFAIQHALPGLLLDIACGSGYGSDQISQNNRFRDTGIKAVDISEQAIAYAQSRYGNSSIEFICADANSFTNAFLFDTIVSLETIEHLNNPEEFAKKLSAMLKKDGMLIVSAPVTPSTDGNPNHLTDFNQSGFKKIFTDLGFIEKSRLLQVQSFSVSDFRRSDNKRLRQTRQKLTRFYLSHPGVFFKRLYSLVVDGFNNKYLTLAFKKT